MVILDSTKAYKAPQAKVIEVKERGVLCSSPGVNGWDGGSSSDGGDMEED